VKGGWRIGLTTFRPSMSRMSENVGASTSRKPKGLHGLYSDNFTFLLKDKLRWEDNIKMDTGEVAFNGVIMSTKMNFWVQFKAGNVMTKLSL
jgi:hypothetical protein